MRARGGTLRFASCTFLPTAPYEVPGLTRVAPNLWPSPGVHYRAFGGTVRWPVRHVQLQVHLKRKVGPFPTSLLQRHYAYFTPSQGSANRSASGGVLGAMARPASANPGLIPRLSTPHTQLSPLVR